MNREKVTRTFSLDKDVSEALDAKANYVGDKSRFVNEALKAYLGLKKEERS